MTDKITLMRNVSIFHDLPEHALETLADHLISRTFLKSSVIVSHEEEGDSLYLVASGSVKVVLYGETGREIILSMFKEGDFFGEMSLLDDQPRSANVIALEESKMLILRRGAFVEMITKHPNSALNILREMSRRLRKADEIIGSLALLDVFGRVAHILRDLAEREGEETPEGVLIRERPTQQNIASMVGTSRETVSRALSEFQRRGFLEIRGKSIVLSHEPSLDDII